MTSSPENPQGDETKGKVHQPSWRVGAATMSLLVTGITLTEFHDLT